MLTNWICLDVSSAPLPNAADYLDGAIKVPSKITKPASREKYIAGEQARRLETAGLDIDLARVTGICYMTDAGISSVASADYLEDRVLQLIGEGLQRPRIAIITFGGFNFDLPLLMRRARYLGVDFPAINLDHYKSPHIDLCEVLADRKPQRRRSLQFYVKRMGWTDLVKPLSGAEESQVPVTGKWDELAASLRHDVTATYRLACWLGIIAPVKAETEQPEPIF